MSDEMKLAEDRAQAFNLSKNSYELLHQMTFPGYLSQTVFQTLQGHQKIMETIIAMVDEFTNPEAINLFKEIVGLKGDEDGDRKASGETN